jgi:hypothetical protein
MVICSFALHLIDNPSELFALLWELSTKSRWLVILAPHKKPEVQSHVFLVWFQARLTARTGWQIKDGWGWTKWNVDAWEECRMSDHSGEYLKDRSVFQLQGIESYLLNIYRVHCRIYRSLNI